MCAGRMPFFVCRFPVSCPLFCTPQPCPNHRIENYPVATCCNLLLPRETRNRPARQQTRLKSPLRGLQAHPRFCGANGDGFPPRLDGDRLPPDPVPGIPAPGRPRAVVLPLPCPLLCFRRAFLFLHRGADFSKFCTLAQKKAVGTIHPQGSIYISPSLCPL